LSFFQLVNELKSIQIKFSQRTNETIFYQFDIELLMRDGSWRSCNRDKRLQVLKTIIEQEHFPFVWYDDRKYLYTKEDLTLKIHS